MKKSMARLALSGALMLLPVAAWANTDILNSTETHLHTSIFAWAGKMQTATESLFFALAAVEVAILFMNHVLKKRGHEDLFSGIIKKTITLGFFLWLINNAVGGIGFMPSIINGLENGATAVGAPPATPSTIADEALDTAVGVLFTPAVAYSNNQSARQTFNSDLKANNIAGAVDVAETQFGKASSKGTWIGPNLKAIMAILLETIIALPIAIIAGGGVFMLALDFLMVTLESYLVMVLGLVVLAGGGLRYTSKYVGSYMDYGISVGVRLFVIAAVSYLVVTALIPELQTIMTIANPYEMAFEAAMLGVIIAILPKKATSIAQTLLNGQSSFGGEGGKALAAGAAGVAAVATGGAALAAGGAAMAASKLAEAAGSAANGSMGPATGAGTGGAEGAASGVPFPGNAGSLTGSGSPAPTGGGTLSPSVASQGAGQTAGQGKAQSSQKAAAGNTTPGNNASSAPASGGTASNSGAANAPAASTEAGSAASSSPASEGAESGGDAAALATEGAALATESAAISSASPAPTGGSDTAPASPRASQTAGQGQAQSGQKAASTTASGSNGAAGGPTSTTTAASNNASSAPASSGAASNNGAASAPAASTETAGGPSTTGGAASGNESGDATTPTSEGAGSGGDGAATEDSSAPSDAGASAPLPPVSDAHGAPAPDMQSMQRILEQIARNTSGPKKGISPKQAGKTIHEAISRMGQQEGGHVKGQGISTEHMNDFD
ncbi:P-type conjugative transfer protein TrbL [Candidatus Igneacidithiobacillus taiwanensis]|uniref:P-type conjugative transfer protein TrbL n=1 Tax=Candidatus Igneacidithiobacillus taiwanensis TaxID=1945924 RepID=UPI0028A227F5|nr:P-type conjugative transfer protein TrbL [Candidatus Igneacidithiobacillus taiwanensis]